jgi:hypothetical protein
MSEVLCQVCGLPLPVTRRWNQLYHSGECKRYAVQKAKNIFRRQYTVRCRIARRYPHRKKDPMKLLGMDYVKAKLAEFAKGEKSP